MMCKRFLVYVLIYALTSVVVSEEEDSDCQRPGVEEGKCIRLYKCHRLHNLLEADEDEEEQDGDYVDNQDKKEIFDQLRQLSCGFAEDDVPLICCAKYKYKKSPLEIPNINSKISEIEELVEPLLPPNCGATNDSDDGWIVGGAPVRLGELPWMVALGYKDIDKPDLPLHWFCGGSLISKRHVLTAAHCVRTSINYELHTARFGDLDLHSEDDGAIVSDIPIKFAKVHEDYDPIIERTNDIALLTLEKDVDNPTVWPICLPVSESFENRVKHIIYPYVAGWGSERFMGPASHVLQWASLETVKEDQCKEDFKKHKKAVIDKRVICAGYKEDTPEGACTGDSGGPLMYIKEESSYFYAIGVVAHSVGCAEPHFPGVYMKVEYYLDWIRENMKI